jgi:type IV pilus assembly protein PilP
MGQNFGRILQIKPDRIELVELVSDSPGSWEERPAALDLNESSANEEGRKSR